MGVCSSSGETLTVGHQTGLAPRETSVDARADAEVRGWQRRMRLWRRGREESRWSGKVLGTAASNAAASTTMNEEEKKKKTARSRRTPVRNRMGKNGPGKIIKGHNGAFDPMCFLCLWFVPPFDFYIYIYIN